MSAGSSEDEFPNGENTPVVKVEVPDGENDPKDLEGRDNVKTEPGLMAEHQGLPIEERPNVTTATSGLSNDPPALSRSYTLADKDKRSVHWQGQYDSNNNDERAQDASRTRGEPSKRPDKQPPSLSVSVTVSQTDGACGGEEGQFSDADSMEDGTQMSSTMLLSESTAESTIHGSSWDR